MPTMSSKELLPTVTEYFLNEESRTGQNQNQNQNQNSKQQQQQKLRLESLETGLK